MRLAISRLVLVNITYYVNDTWWADTTDAFRPLVRLGTYDQLNVIVSGRGLVFDGLKGTGTWPWPQTALMTDAFFDANLKAIDYVGLTFLTFREGACKQVRCTPCQLHACALRPRCTPAYARRPGAKYVYVDTFTTSEAEASYILIHEVRYLQVRPAVPTCLHAQAYDTPATCLLHTACTRACLPAHVDWALVSETQQAQRPSLQPAAVGSNR